MRTLPGRFVALALAASWMATACCAGANDSPPAYGVFLNTGANRAKVRSMRQELVGVGVILAAGAAPAREQAHVNSVVLVKNLNSPDSVAIADYYVRRRNLPARNVCPVRIADVEECSYTEFNERLKAPLKQFLAHLKRPIDYIVLTRGIPIRLHEGTPGGMCVDSLLVTLDREEPATAPGGLDRSAMSNPYYGCAAPFSHARFGIYLVTRLIGYTRADCCALVDRSLAARPCQGPFLLHTGPGHNEGGYKAVNEGMRQANEVLSARRMVSVLSTGDAFPGNYVGLMGYFSWGSNDQKFDKHAYNSLGFAPGSLAETAVSSSARTFADPQDPGQSLIADLIAQGVTGCKGYVSEPGVSAIANAAILFDRYTAGANLAESFYAASRYTHWKDMVIGDPICAPYADTPLSPPSAGK